MNKIILSLLLISIAFVGIGAAAASDVDNVVSDVANPNVISLENPNVISSDRPQMDRPFYTVDEIRPFYTAEDIYNVPVVGHVPIAGHVPIVGQDVDIFDGDYFHPIQPVDPYGPFDPKL